jgi:hypothetical protein
MARSRDKTFRAEKLVMAATDRSGRCRARVSITGNLVSTGDFKTCHREFDWLKGLGGGPKTGRHTLMPRAQPKSVAEIFYNFVSNHPTIAAKLAFELGLVGGSAAKTLPWKRLKKASTNSVTAIPRQFSQAALKLLPASPDLQPQSSRPSKTRKRSRRHKPEQSHGKKDQ